MRRAHALHERLTWRPGVLDPAASIRAGCAGWFPHPRSHAGERALDTPRDTGSLRARITLPLGGCRGACERADEGTSQHSWEMGWWARHKCPVRRCAPCEAGADAGGRAWPCRTRSCGMGHALWYGSPRCVGHGQREKKEMSMCLSCGCDAPNDRHGDDRHIRVYLG